MPTFYVYENTANGSGARIHRGDCMWCNDGRGHRNPSKPSGNSGHWHGPYATRDDARYAADRLIEDATKHPGMAVVSACQKCLPERR